MSTCKCVQCGGTVPSGGCTIEQGDGFEVAICDKCHVDFCLSTDRVFQATTDPSRDGVNLHGDDSVLWHVQTGDRVKDVHYGYTGIVQRVSVTDSGRITISIRGDGFAFSNFSEHFKPDVAVCLTCGCDTRRFHGSVGQAICYRCAEKNRPSTSDDPSRPQFTLTLEGRKLASILASIGERGSFTVTVKVEGKP